MRWRFPGPEAQFDRFAMRLSIGVPNRATELALLQAARMTSERDDAPAAWEDLVRRTEVGIWIRRGSVSHDMTATAEVLRERIEALEHAVLDPGRAHRRC
jgi:MoxR-like ATPase